MRKPRQTLRDKKLALREKKGLKRIPKFPRPRIRGRVIYSNPNAVPVAPTIREPGAREPFRLENVEYIRFSSPLVIGPSGNRAKGGFGSISSGTIKFKGKASSQRVIIKKIHSHIGEEHVSKLPLVIARLNRSGVPHPKMAFFIREIQRNKEYFIIMEPFVQKAGPVALSKFESGRGDFISKLNLEREGAKNLFRQVVKYTGLLARAGLRIATLGSITGGPKVDVFDVITLKNGEQKVLVQDLDAFFLADDHQANWEQSTEALIKVNSYRIHGNAPIAKQIVLEVAKEMGFSQR